jgi:hypothetical protein
MPSSTQKLDLTDLISLICLFRRENYVFERHLALLTFGLWVVEPNDINFVRHGRLVGAAQIVKSLVQKDRKISLSSQRRFLEQEFSPNLVSSALISPPMIGPFKDEIESRKNYLELAESIAETFLRAPPSKLRTRRPSLNKAIHFIASGGYGRDFKFAPATIKRQWVTHAVIAPFLLVEPEVNIKLIGLAPDTPQWLKSTNAILNKKDELLEFFDLAKSVQETFVSKLDPVSRKRFLFVEFPAQTESIPFEFEPFSGDEQKIYQSYSAPKY